MTKLNIQVDRTDQTLLVHAADELVRYARHLFGFAPTINGDRGEHTVPISAADNDQDYAFQTDGKSMRIMAGSHSFHTLDLRRFSRPRQEAAFHRSASLFFASAQSRR